MKRAHITLVPRILSALEALAAITGQSVSRLLNEAATEYLRTRNLLPEVTPQMIADQMKAAHLPQKKNRPTAAQVKSALADVAKEARSARATKR